MTPDIITDIQVSLTDTQLERALVAALLIDTEATAKVRDILTPAMLADKVCATIYAACLEACEQEGSVDLLTVTNRLRKSGDLATIGGPSALVDISQTASSAAHVQSWAYAIAEKHNRRTLVATLNQMTLAAMDEGTTVDGALYTLKAAIEDFARQIALGSPVPPLKDGVREAYTRLMDNIARVREGKPLQGVPTGLVRLDRALGNLQPGCLYILAARPAMGKTAMMLNMAKAAAEAGHPAVVFSLEMSARQIADRCILAATDGWVDGEEYRRATISDEGLRAIDNAIDPLGGLAVYVDDCSAATMDYIRNKARKMRDEGRCDAVYIDYLQLVGSPDTLRKSATREQEVSQMSRAAKLMAKELDVPVVLLSQLNRAVESRGDKRPVLADLRESGAIEQDADAVLFVHRAAYYVTDPAAAGIPANSGEVIVAKNRHGRTGSVPFSHNGSITRIFDYE